MSGNEEMSSQAKDAIRAWRRFPGFDGIWQRTELRPFLVRYAERVSADTELEIYSSSREGLLPQDKYYGGNKLLNSGEYGVVPDGCFVYRHMSDDTTFKFNINNTGRPIAVSKEYPVFSTHGVDATFLNYLLNESYPFKQYAAMQRKGGTRTRLYFETLCSWRAPLPSLPEQQRIAECLSSIDALIEAETEKRDALRDHKKGLMQQLFPAEGETVPRMRFPRFEGSWAETKLGAIATFSKGKGIAKKDIDAEGNSYCIRYGELYTTYDTIIDEPVSKTSTNATDLVLSQGGEVIIPASGEDANDIATAAVVMRPGIALGGDLNIVSSLLVDGAFLAYYLSGAKRRALAAMAQGNTIVHLYPSQLETLGLAIPCSAEQFKIANCLVSIDELSAIHGQRLAALRILKCGLLQQLFPILDEVL